MRATYNAGPAAFASTLNVFSLGGADMKKGYVSCPCLLTLFETQHATWQQQLSYCNQQEQQQQRY